MRTRLPALRTLPSSTLVTFSWLAMSGMLALLPLKANEEVREATCRPSTLTSRLSSSSAMPSEKYSWAGSSLMLTNGSTAIELRLSLGAGCADFWAAGSASVLTAAAGSRAWGR